MPLTVEEYQALRQQTLVPLVEQGCEIVDTFLVAHATEMIELPIVVPIQQLKDLWDSAYQKEIILSALVDHYQNPREEGAKAWIIVVSNGSLSFTLPD